MITDAEVRAKALEVMYDFAQKANGEQDYEDALALMAVELLDEAVAFDDWYEGESTEDWRKIQDAGGIYVDPSNGEAMAENQADGLGNTDDIQPWDENLDEFNPFDDDDEEIWPEALNESDWQDDDDEDDWSPLRSSEIRDTELF